MQQRTIKKAVELGMGEYVVADSSTGATEFQWKNISTNGLAPWLTTTATNSDKEVFIINVYKK